MAAEPKRPVEPFVWLMLAGLWEVWRLIGVGLRRGVALAGFRRERREAKDGVSGQQAWAALIWVVGLAAFQLYCLVGLIWPYYRQ